MLFCQLEQHFLVVFWIGFFGMMTAPQVAAEQMVYKKY
jgi:hypothetical protein